MQNYTIGDKEYTREELLVFGKRHYPKFYWIKRGIGIGLMSVFGLTTIIMLWLGLMFQQMFRESGDEIYKYMSQGYYVSACIFGVFLVVGIILFSMSFVSKPDEVYIKHAIDYYTKQNANNARREVRVEVRRAREQVVLEEAKAKQEIRVQAMKEEEITGELVKYKKLLDAGIITQEEFEQKKKELL